MKFQISNAGIAVPFVEPVAEPVVESDVASFRPLHEWPKMLVFNDSQGFRHRVFIQDGEFYVKHGAKAFVGEQVYAPDDIEDETRWCKAELIELC